MRDELRHGHHASADVTQNEMNYFLTYDAKSA